jgi:hypothetical protein
MSCIWPDTISRWIRQMNSIKFCTNLREECDGDPGKRSGKKARMACSVQGRSQKGETGEEQSQEHDRHFLALRRLFTKNSSRQVKQSIRILLWLLRRLCENGWRIYPEFWRQKTGCCLTTTHRLTLPSLWGHPVVLYYHTFQIYLQSKLRLLLLYFSLLTTCFGPYGPSSGEIQYHLHFLKYHQC